ncbi:hypothetical protein L198_00698 [Cryptococcus wingfieldii CBS 7118]|uniref:Uncharacterized protein n=1 Tax=Cryptococcus wingfieldii CBS 7118 TaxID=1295528 RepID=A0A1E3K7A4_9TREE|nr:hypothetical protein L198_00698 [Cryptococcus wingfieldii CBS 7118]ODO08959.1 hypothetical protein L198_00698 [Cryptococcus wingfieldii CBS 7118]
MPTKPLDEDTQLITATGTNTPLDLGTGKGRIAVDMDDVLCQTNVTIVNSKSLSSPGIFGTQPPLTLDDFQNYLYWMNRGWGNPEETIAMVTKLYAEGLYMKAPPVEGAKEALKRLKDLGYSLVIITARSEGQREGTEEWLTTYLPDIFDEIHFTGAFQDLEPTKKEHEGHATKKAIVSHKKRSKAEIVYNTQSLFLIDDSAENAYDTAIANFPHPQPTKVLLFGNYPWNAIVHTPETTLPVEKITFVAKQEQGLLEEAERVRRGKIEEGWLPEGVERVGDWGEVVRWVEGFESRGGAGGRV